MIALVGCPYPLFYCHDDVVTPGRLPCDTFSACKGLRVAPGRAARSWASMQRQPSLTAAPSPRTCFSESYNDARVVEPDSCSGERGCATLRAILFSLPPGNHTFLHPSSISNKQQRRIHEVGLVRRVHETSINALYSRQSREPSTTPAFMN